MSKSETIKLLTSIKSEVESPLHQDNCPDIVLLEQLIEEGHVKAVIGSSASIGTKVFNAKLTSKGELYLQKLSVIPSSKRQADSLVWTFDRRVKIYGVLIALITLTITTAKYLQ